MIFFWFQISIQCRKQDVHQLGQLSLKLLVSTVRCSYREVLDLQLGQHKELQQQRMTHLSSLYKIQAILSP